MELELGHVMHALKMATSGYAGTGYVCDFVESPPSAIQFQCPVCLLVLREPYQATCCGTSFCKECIHRIKAVHQICPICRDSHITIYPNKGLQQSLYNFRVYCTHKDKGCEWTGELRILDNHLNSDPPADYSLQGCPYTLINCPLGCDECKKGVYRKDIKAHVGDKMLSSEAIQPVQTRDARAKLEQRMSKLEEKVKELVASKPHPLGQSQRPDGRITGTVKPIRAEFIMNDFMEYKRDSDSWYSPHFYTHSNGYKMCLRVFANGNGSGHGTHLSVFVYLMQGEFDNQLKWPFQGNITVKLVNQEEDRDHVIETFYSKNAGERCERVMTNERVENGWGIGQFLSHAELQPKYLKNDCIKLCVKKIDLY